MKTRTIYKVEMWVSFGDLGDHSKEWYFDTLDLAAEFMKAHCTKSISQADWSGKEPTTIWGGSRLKNKVEEHYSMRKIELIEEMSHDDK